MWQEFILSELGGSCIIPRRDGRSLMRVVMSKDSVGEFQTYCGKGPKEFIDGLEVGEMKRKAWSEAKPFHKRNHGNICVHLMFPKLPKSVSSSGPFCYWELSFPMTNVCGAVT